MPLAYIMDGENYIVAASFVSFGKKPGWLHNLTSHPEAIIEVKSTRIPVFAEQANETERERLWAMLLQAEPGYARFAARSQAPIPIIILHKR